jgi:hypothetical protein
MRSGSPVGRASRPGGEDRVLGQQAEQPPIGRGEATGTLEPKRRPGGTGQIRRGPREYARRNRW